SSASTSGAPTTKAVSRRWLMGKSSLAALLQELGDDGRPARLVSGAHAGAVVPVEVFVEQQQIAPVRILLELLGAPVDRPAAVGPAQEDAGQPPRQPVRHLPQVDHRPRPPVL